MATDQAQTGRRSGGASRADTAYLEGLTRSIVRDLSLIHSAPYIQVDGADGRHFKWNPPIWPRWVQLLHAFFPFVRPYPELPKDALSC